MILVLFGFDVVLTSLSVDKLHTHFFPRCTTFCVPNVDKSACDETETPTDAPKSPSRLDFFDWRNFLKLYKLFSEGNKQPGCEACAPYKPYSV